MEKILARLGAVCIILGFTGITGCNDSSSEPKRCDPTTFQSYCDGNTAVRCETFSVNEISEDRIDRIDCTTTNRTCAVLDHEASCRDDICTNPGARRGEEICKVVDLNQPGIYVDICTEEEGVLHWVATKVSDCEGICFEKECHLAGEKCTDLRPMGCHGNDLYYCDGNPNDQPHSIKVRHCSNNQICDNDSRWSSFAYCTNPCSVEGEEATQCSDNGLEIDKVVCTSTNSGLYYLKPSNNRANFVPGGTFVCNGTEMETIDEFSECNPENDKDYCNHNVAVRCHHFSINNEETDEWVAWNCGKPDQYRQQYGLCQVIDEKAVCLSTCQAIGVKHKTCTLGTDSEGLFDTNTYAVVEYECREINGNLYDYPISYHDCNRCNSDQTDCED